MKYFILFILCFSSAMAQYSKEDAELIETTFTREFDKTLITEYFITGEPAKIKAALLAISNSSDTTFFNLITSVPFAEYGDYVAFTLGQIGKSKKSSEFLYNKLLEKDNPFTRECFIALGKICNQVDYNSVINSLEKDLIENRNGYPVFVYHFNSQKAISDKKRIQSLFLNELKTSSDQQMMFDVLFTLYRITPTRKFEKEFIKILKNENLDSTLKAYVLSNFRKLKYFPKDEFLFNRLLANKNWNVKVEAAKALCYYSKLTPTNLESYLKLLDDRNPNVSRQAAISVKNISKELLNETKVKGDLQDRLYNNFYSQNTFEEFLISYSSIFPDEALELLKVFENKIGSNAIYRMLAIDNNSINESFEFIRARLNEADEVELIDAYSSMIQMQDSLYTDIEFQNIILNGIASTHNSIISLISDQLSNKIIDLNKDLLKGIITNQIAKFFEDSNYSDAIISLTNLSKKISNKYYAENIALLKSSEIYRIKKYLSSLFPNDEYIKDDNGLMEDIISASFRYTKANVITNKGVFVISFRPEYAPISVGNFIYLTEQNYFNNVIFHRVVPNFVIQTGDPSGTGWSGPGYEIVSETSMLPYHRSYVGMASSGRDTEGSQWFVMHSNFPHLDGKYTNFGKVIKGMDVVDKIDQYDKILRVELE